MLRPWVPAFAGTTTLCELKSALRIAGVSRGGRRSNQEDRHPGQDHDDHQQRDLDEPGKADPGPAMSFEFRIDRCHLCLAVWERARPIYSSTARRGKRL